MLRAIGIGLPALGIVAAVAAWAQVDSVILALNHCVDANRAADERIKNCMQVIGAKGITSDELAFAYLDLGVVYQSQHDDADELDAFNKSITLQPKLWLTRIDRAALYVRRGEIDSALADFHAAQDAPPGAVELEHFDMGVGYRAGRADGTTQSDIDSPARDEAQYKRSLDQVAQWLLYDFARRCRARAAANVELDSALADCNTALQIDPKSEAALDSRALVQFRRGDWADALADCQSALAINEKSIAPLYLRGLVEQRMGNTAAGNADIAAARAMRSAVPNAQGGAISGQ